MSFLKQVIEEKKADIEYFESLLKSTEPVEALFNEDAHSYLRKKIESDGFLFFAEVKRKSPSAGIINAELNAEDIAQTYAQCGAHAISILTDSKRFMGSFDDLRKAALSVQAPILMKDFVVSDVQLRLAEMFGASIVLLISEALGPHISCFVELSKEVGVEPLIETRSEKQIYQALEAGGRIIGVNSRDLNTLRIDLKIFEKLSPLVREIKSLKPDTVFIAESGITEVEEVVRLKELGFDGVLIGSRLGRHDGIEFLRKAVSACKKNVEV